METIAILGAGTMGAGIAQAALAVGLPVLLYDVSAQMLEGARSRVAAGLARQGLPEAIAALRLASHLDELAGVALVIEAAPEQLELKRELFARLGTICPPPCVLASNTSSLPIAALAAACPGSQRVAGLHFFNPVHRMALVEVVRAPQTSDATIASLLAFVERLGKTPVQARDTPGFVVNRVARPFYGEALRLLGEGAAGHAAIDAVLQRAGGFPLGPFALMDLIGIDVNFAVTRSLYEQSFGEPRYRPHPIQQQMLLQGRLGRKTGRGFYMYDQGSGFRVQGSGVGDQGSGIRDQGIGNRGPGAHQETGDERQETRDRRRETGEWGRESQVSNEAEPPNLQSAIYNPSTEFTLSAAEGLRASLQSAMQGSVLIGGGSWAPGLAELCQAAGLDVTEELPYGESDVRVAFVVAGRGEGAADQVMVLDRRLPAAMPIFMQCADLMASELAALIDHPERLIGFDGLFMDGAITLVDTPLLNDETRAVAEALVRSLGREPIWVADTPALIVPRVVSMLANEAAFAVGEGVADAATVDLALRLGANHPVGPLERAAALGYERIVALLDHLQREYGEERYRVAPLLRRAARVGRMA